MVLTGQALLAALALIVVMVLVNVILSNKPNLAAPAAVGAAAGATANLGKAH